MATDKVGYIKLHRSIVDEIVWKWPATRYKIYSAIYRMVNWNECHWQYRGKVYHCMPGQTVTSYSKIAEYCESSDITPRIVRTTCRLLVENGYITMEPEYKAGIKITFLKWEREQVGYLPGEGEPLPLEEPERSQNRSQNRSQSLNPETTDIIDENSSDEKKRSQSRSQSRSTIEESFKNNKEKEASRPQLLTSSSNSETINTILDEYFTLYHKTTGRVKDRTKHQRGMEATIIKNSIDKKNIDDVISNLCYWFENCNPGAIENDYPLGYFTTKYDEVDNKRQSKQKDNNRLPHYAGDDCDKCGGMIYTNRPHRCEDQNYCPECQCGLIPGQAHDCEEHKKAAQARYPDSWKESS